MKKRIIINYRYHVKGRRVPSKERQGNPPTYG